MVGFGVPAAAPSAAVLGSRNARRQLKAVLADAAAAGAYSVGFGVVRLSSSPRPLELTPASRVDPAYHVDPGFSNDDSRH